MNRVFEKIKKWLSGLHMNTVSYKRTGVTPSHDWFVLLMVAQTLACISVFLSYYLYIRIDENSLFPTLPVTPDTGVSIDGPLLHTIVDAVHVRAIHAQKLTQASPSPDPSL